MSVITYSLNRVKLAIPKEILDLAFLSKSNTYNVNTTLSNQILELVLNPIVLTDINILSGKTLKVSLDNCNVTEYQHINNNTNIIINVPFKLTNNAKVVSPISLTINDVESYNDTANPLTNNLNKVVNRVMPENIPGMLITNLELIASNTILVHDNMPFTTSGFLEVIIENNKNLSNIKPRSYPLFSKLVILAVKAYIYNELVVTLEEGSLYYGHNLSKVSSIIEGWESSLDDYDELLKTKWGKTAFMNDDPSYSSFIKMMVSPNM